MTPKKKTAKAKAPGYLIRFPDGVRGQLQHEAKARRWPLSEYIRYLLETHPERARYVKLEG